MSDAGPIGIAIVAKEAGWTSHDVVARARKLLGTRKVGHAGTLDPDATGVLVLGVGRATRILRFITALPKTYTATVVLGVETSTLDASGEVTASHDMSGVTVAAVEQIAAGFVGEIEQVPPMVSAVKVGGRRLHELAREGQEVEREPRTVTIHRLDVGDVDLGAGTFTIEVECSSGTYIRTLGADIGVALGGGAHIRDLVRTSVGSLGLDAARPLDDLQLLPPAEGLADLSSVVVGPDLAVDVGHGKVLDAARLGVEEPGPWAVLAPDGDLLAVYVEHRGTSVKPAVVLVG